MINISGIQKTDMVAVAGVVGKKPFNFQCKHNSITSTSKEGHHRHSGEEEAPTAGEDGGLATSEVKLTAGMYWDAPHATAVPT